MKYHLLFAPTGTLKRKTRAYHAIHDDLRACVVEKDGSDKRGRRMERAATFKQTGEVTA